MRRPHGHECEACGETFGCVEQARCPELCGPCEQAAWAAQEDDDSDD
jgi:hypothetical protein